MTWDRRMVLRFLLLVLPGASAFSHLAGCRALGPPRATASAERPSPLALASSGSLLRGDSPVGWGDPPPVLKKRGGQQGASAMHMSSDPGDMIFSQESECGAGTVQVWERVFEEEEGKVMRTLWFSGSPEVWQSAVVLDKDPSGNVRPDFRRAPTFHSCKGLALAAALPPSVRNVLLIGLGGGALCGWLLDNHVGLERLVACELDNAVAVAAKECFLGSLGEDGRLEIHVGDGIEYAKQQGTATFDLIIVDASESAEPGLDGRGPTAEGVWAPPRALRTESCYQTLREVMTEDGVLAVNVLARDPIDLLDFVSVVNASFQGCVSFLENRDRSHSWMLTPDNKIVFATRNSAASFLTEEGMTERVLAYADKVPASKELDLTSRVRKELTTLDNLCARAQQLRVYRDNHRI